MLIVAALIAIGAVVLDQVTKALVVSHMTLHQELPFLPGFMRFYYTQNKGAAFSILSDHPWVFLVFSAVAMAVIVYLLYRFRGRHPLLTVSLAMILGGGIGNMIDRVVNGYVVDFLDFQFVKFAVFNVADIFVTCGSVALGIYLIVIEPRVEKRLRDKEKTEQKESPHDGNDPD